MPIDEHRQFQTLYRQFLFRVIDLELLTASGEVRNLLAQFAALLAAYSFVLALAIVWRFTQSSAEQSKLMVSAWGTEEFLISSTLTVVGLFSILSWNAILPSRRDSYVLGALPVRTITVAGAKMAATVTALAISIVAVNCFTGLSLPFLAINGSGVTGALRCALAYWATMAAAGMFMFLAIFALQNLALTVLSYRTFQRVSGLLQLLAFFVILALFFLTPPLVTPAGLTSAANQHLLAWLPSFWFLGLFQELNGNAYAAFAPLAVHAGLSFLVVFLLALVTASVSTHRSSRKIIEQPEIAPGKHASALAKLISWLTLRLLSDPIDRAIFLFSSRTLARSQQHRLVLSVYVGIAFAISLAYAKSIIYGSSVSRWDQPSVPLLLTSLVTLFFAVIGSRAVFALPFALPANWIFRISAVRSPASYFSAVRKSLFIIAAIPVLAGSAVVYFCLWPGRPALQHLLMLIVLGGLLVQISLRRFRKIPFACSYLPGKSDLRIKLGITGFLFLLAVEVWASIEYWSMQKPARYVAFVSLLIAATFWAARRTAVFAGSPYNCLQFEDLPVADIYALDLRRDSDYVNQGDYLDAIASLRPPPNANSPDVRHQAEPDSLTILRIGWQARLQKSLLSQKPQNDDQGHGDEHP